MCASVCVSVSWLMPIYCHCSTGPESTEVAERITQTFIIVNVLAKQTTAALLQRFFRQKGVKEE